MMLAITKAQSGSGFAYHHRGARGAMVERAKNPCRREKRKQSGGERKSKKYLDCMAEPC